MYFLKWEGLVITILMKILCVSTRKQIHNTRYRDIDHLESIACRGVETMVFLISISARCIWLNVCKDYNQWYGVYSTIPFRRVDTMYI